MPPNPGRRVPSPLPPSDALRTPGAVPAHAGPCGASGLAHRLRPCRPSHGGFPLHRLRHRRPPWRFAPKSLGAPARLLSLAGWRTSVTRRCSQQAGPRQARASHRSPVLHPWWSAKGPHHSRSSPRANPWSLGGWVVRVHVGARGRLCAFMLPVPKTACPLHVKFIDNTEIYCFCSEFIIYINPKMIYTLQQHGDALPGSRQLPRR